MSETVDLAIVGAGAAGLMAGIQAGRTGLARRIVLIDGARSIGAKIRISGGGRCNITHERVDESAFAGSSRHAIRKVLLRFDVPRTIAFFEEIGIPLKREETGKLFPVSDDARTVVDALLRAVRSAGAEIRNPWRVDAIEVADSGFILNSTSGENLNARRVILATGGRSIPKTGSDGRGYAIVEALGHTVSPVFPALVPLLLADGSFVRTLGGISTPATLSVRSPRRGSAVSFTGSVLCTHFGISGPTTLDISRYFVERLSADPETELSINWLPEESVESADVLLRDPGGGSFGRLLAARLPERLARALCDAAGVDPSARQATREQRRALATTLCNFRLPVSGTRGFHYAEVTAGGVPLSEVKLETMESRISPGLHLCGEICDVDGRIGGFNFHWAWASGYIAGVSASSSR